MADVLHNFNPTLIASFNIIVNVGLRNLLYEVCFVPHEPPVINGAYTPEMVITE